MHLLGISLLLAYLLYSNLASDSSLSDYYEDPEPPEQIEPPVSYCSRSPDPASGDNMKYTQLLYCYGKGGTNVLC
ncbi:THUMP domain containing protein 3 [Dissostichus eleginoides]|uniref:THUMP domain containing protein 3 n=1 Tax=Dissostichus eleginoides TaxID=100907 RepID=A0AAD9BS94_DISEL|nr:THUMP domain containing protein 3 [Dissostichus eleginoides]